MSSQRPQPLSSRADRPEALVRNAGKNHDVQMKALTELASVNIETSLARDLSGSLHSLFDGVCDRALPIYFGPLLGRLYLQGL